jgi:Uma2 family endonuclease
MSAKPRTLLRLRFAEAAREYAHSLTLEDYMEGETQARQRAIFLGSLPLVGARRPDVHIYNELLLQTLRKDGRVVQVVPDNMVVIHPGPITAGGSYDVDLQPARPFWVLEYVSPHDKRKDYEGSFDKYERDLKVPYYLLFNPEIRELTLFRHNRKRFVSVKPNAAGRLAIPELEMEVALLDDWVRFWYQGELLPLPPDLQRELDKARRQAAEATRRADQEAQRADQEAQRADHEAQRADQEAQRANEATRRAEEVAHQAEQERQSRLATEQELAQLRAQLERFRRQTPTDG